MGTITHTFDAGQTVWVITTASASCVSAIRKGVVIQVRGTALTTGDTVKYDVRLEGDNGTTETAEANIYATYGEASAAYAAKLGGSPIA